MDFLKKIFGLHNNNHHYNENYFQQPDDNESGRQNDDDIQRRGFDVFTDPLHMQQYFENQMNEMLKIFGFQGFDHGFFSEFHSIPTLEEESTTERESKELRDQFLKSGYEKPSVKQDDKMDKDIDGKIHLGDLDSAFGRKSNIGPYEKYNSNRFLFGQSQSIKTIRNSDGSIETHRTVRDNEGNEEITVCYKIGDKEYCLTKKKDKHGEKEIVENFVNMNESEKDKLFNLKNRTPLDSDQQHSKDFPFDKFFK